MRQTIASKKNTGFSSGICDLLIEAINHLGCPMAEVFVIHWIVPGAAVPIPTSQIILTFYPSYYPWLYSVLVQFSTYTLL